MQSIFRDTSRSSTCGRGTGGARRGMGLWALALLAGAFAPAAAHAALTVTPLTWNIVGLDSNSPLTGPKNFPVGARICSDVAATNVTADFVFDSANAFIDLRVGSLSSLNFASIPAGGCVDAYFEVEVQQTAAAYDTARRYHINATDGSGTYSTPTPRELYVEHLVSQSRNAITNVRYGLTPATLQSVGPGGALNLVVGNIYTIELSGGTATQGYEQFEAFINFSNAVFQILSVSTTYSADTSIYVASPNDKLYADACLWENDPNSPNYRACVGTAGKAGGSNVVTTYTILIVGGGGSSQTLNTLLYDFSGSSFHYNGDYSTGARIANIVDPASATIAKAFAPNPIPVDGVSALTITLGNPNADALTGFAVTDNLPAGMVIASPANATTSGCGTPTLTAPAGSNTISFSNGTVAGNGTCVIKVDVTAGVTDSYLNTTENLFVGGIDTGQSASATLTVDNAPPPGTGLCGQPIASWQFPTGFNVNTPAPFTGSGSALAGPGLAPNSQATLTGVGTSAWGSNGSITAGALNTGNNEYFEFAIDTTGRSSVTMDWVMQFKSGNGPDGVALYVGTGAAPGTQIFYTPNAIPTQNTNQAFSQTVNSGLNPAGLTFFRVYSSDSGNSNPGSDPVIDDVVFTGCGAGTPPTLAKSFSPDPIAVNGISTLSFTLTNPNASPLTGAAFDDTLPAGTQVAATPAAATTCGGTWTPAAGATVLGFTGGTIPATGSCTVSVNVTATTPGPHTNVSGFLSTLETGTSTGSVATDMLTAVLPPQIAKQFSPSPVLPNAPSRLTFTLVNPNPDHALSGVAFGDPLPVAPGAMQVAPVPNVSTSGCGAPAFAPAAGATTLSFSGGTIAAGGTCVVSVDVVAAAVGSYANTSGNVSHVVNAQTVNGNTATATLEIVPPNPAIGLLKEVGPTAAGPWSSALAVDAPADVFYRFTLENTGDVPLSPVSIDDPMVSTAACVPPGTLPVAVAANEDHLFACTVGPVAVVPGVTVNTATATGTFGGNDFDDVDSATYATTGLTLDKSAVQSTFTAAGDVIDYTYLVTNDGFASLPGPVTVADDRTTVTCPAVSTVGDLDNFLDPGESITCTATYIVIATDVTAASVTNTATASVDGVDSNADQATVVLASAADVSVVKTLATAGPFTVGQSVTYTLFVANAGPSTATDVAVTDNPSNLTITNVSGGGCAALPCTVPVLPNGSSVNITVTATIDAAGAFDNLATVDANEPDPDPSDNLDDDDNGGVTGVSADVGIVKTLDTAGPYLAGQQVTYSLLVGNAGPSAATNILVTDSPSNLTITGVSGSGCAALPCTIPALPAGSSTLITVTAIIVAAGPFDNVASAFATEPDPDTSDNTDDTGNGSEAAPSADVSLVKTLVTAGPYSVGQSIQYSLVIANAGPSDASNVQVVDTATNLTITGVSGSGCAALPCTIPNLAAGTSATVTVTATIPSAGTFDNAATATAAENDPVPPNNTDDTDNGGEATPSADVSVVKTLGTAGPYTVGQTVAYTLVVSNAGPSIATNVQVTDTPSNLSIASVSGAGCAALPCTIASLGVGASATIDVTATIVAAGAFDNVATVAATEPDPDTSNNTDDAGNGGSADGSVDVSMVKTLLTAGPFSAGQSVQYSLVVANAGPSTATSIEVSDAPTNLSITAVSGDCAALPCTLASLASGASATITVTATIDTAGAFDNAATATPSETDSDPSDNTDNTDNGGITPDSADVSVVKTLVTAGPFTVGQSVTYTLLVANAGPSTATSVQVTDTPTNLTITGVTGACNALPCTIPSLAAGADATITVTATIPAAGPFDNAATVAATEPDPDTTNNTDDDGNGDTASESATPVLNVVKTATPNPFVVGQPASYSITVSNSGMVASTGDITLSDQLPAGITLTSATGTSWNCTGTSLLACTFSGTLAASGGSTTLVLNVAVAASATTADNSATASGGGDTGCPAAGRCTGTITVGVAPTIDVSLTKTLVTAGPYTVGQAIQYTLVIANAGPSTATAIQVTDTPTNLTLGAVSGACTALPCTLPSLAAGASVTIGVEATIVAAGAFDNAATAMPAESDPSPPNNTDNTGNNGIAEPPAGPQLTVTKTATPSAFAIGAPARYDITVANTGGAATSAPITLADSLPAGITLTSASGTGWTCAGTTSITCTFAGSLANGASTTVTLNVMVGAGTSTGTNTATASGGGDAGCPAAARCSGTVAVGLSVPLAAPLTIPLLDARGLALLLLGLLAIAQAAMKRRP